MIDNVLYLIGGTCSGKTTLARELEKRGFTWIRSITTRPKRPGETDEYRFWMSQSGFNLLYNNGALDYIRTYETHDEVWEYAFLKMDLDFDPRRRYVMIGDPVSAVRALNEFSNVMMLAASPETARERLKVRGCSEGFAQQRLDKDDSDFNGLLWAVTKQTTDHRWFTDGPAAVSGPPFELSICYNDAESDIPKIIDYIERRIPA